MAAKPTGRKMLVMKFGGTSVGSAKAMAQAMGIVESNRSDWERMAVIVSALSGTTNLLLDSAIQSAEGKQSTHLQAEAELRSRHIAMAEAFLSPGARQDKFRSEMEELIG
jgi:aspartokinase